MVQNRVVHSAVLNVTEAFQLQQFEKYKILLGNCATVEFCLSTREKGHKESVEYFQEEHLSQMKEFKRAKALARKVRRRRQRESWIQFVSPIT
ncbi:hypothetical protein TNCV_744411 [Trichonephila clavipes]|nr:hypothetical protein TNCV_744411 [Trichonephila clavipes]